MASLIPAVSVPTEGSFNGKPTITFPNPKDVKKPGVCMGVAKIQAVLANMEAAKAFVTKHAKKEEDSPSVAKAIAKLKAMGLSEEDIAEVLK